MLSNANGEYSFEKLHKLFLFLFFVFYLFVAYKNSGYHQEDEHYQIIEFANYKLGLIDAKDLAWEFEAQIRPGLQPLICFLLFKILIFIGITDSYDLAFVLRAITGVFYILVITLYIRDYKSYFSKKLIPYFIFSSYLMWFIPYINVRFSSETYSGLLFILGITLIETLKKRKRTEFSYILVGLLLGLSILFRYQTALLVLGLILWLTFVKKERFKLLLLMFASLLTILIIGIGIDYWLYNHVTFTMYNYFYINLVKGVSSNFGVSPWYEYLRYTFNSLGSIGFLIIVSFLVILRYQPKNIVIWIIVPYFIVHSLIPHKELRFLFPLANFVPFILLTANQIISEIVKNVYSHRKIFSYVQVVILLVMFIGNFGGLVAVSSTGAGTNKTSVTEYINRHYATEKVHIIVNGDINPYIDWGPPMNSFYSSRGLDIEWITSIWQDDFLDHKKAGKINLLIIASDDVTGPMTLDLLKNAKCKKVYQNIPEYVHYIYRYYDPSLNRRAIYLYQFQ